jgi:hypothetical protein
MYTPPAPGQHDTTAIPRPYPPTGGAQGYAPGYGPGYDPRYAPGYGPGYVPGNPAADAWESKYRSQRTRTRIAVALAAVTSAVALVLGVAAWQVTQNPLLSAASQLASGGLDLGGITPPAAPDATAPDPTAPDGTAPGTQSPDSLDVPLAELPIPDSLKSMASAIGITNVGQLLDLAVANGLMSQEDADKLRAGIAAGALAKGLADQGQSQ